MWYLIKTELFKRKKIFVFLFLFGLLPLFYSLGMRFNWNFILINWEYIDLLYFFDAMWILLFMLGIPLAFFMFLSSSILGGEIQGGQILLEVPKVDRRRNIIISKIISNVIFLFCFFIDIILTSTMCFFVNVRSSVYSSENIINSTTEIYKILVSILMGLLYYLMLSICSMLLSLKFSVVLSTLISMGVHVVLKVLSGIENIKIFVPGIIALDSEITINYKNTIIQLFIICLIIFVMTLVVIKQFEKKDL